jgi:uncharacterized protein YecE (DUF72 family)
MTRRAAAYVGTSGWYYDHWEGVLYPPKLPKAKRFDIYAQRFNTVEINATYYRLPSAAMVEGWYRKAPAGFVYVAKASKEITHKSKLRDVQEPVERFLEAVGGLKEKLGNVLFQLPPSLRSDPALLRDFTALLPRSHRYSIEFRNETWECDETYDILRQAGVGHVVVGKKDYPFAEHHTCDIAYYRLHGPERMCASPYDDAWLEKLAQRIERLAREGVASYTFFNNDIGGHAVRNAETLARMLQAQGAR